MPGWRNWLDALALGASGVILGGSSPLPGTNERSEYGDVERT